MVLCWPLALRIVHTCIRDKELLLLSSYLYLTVVLMTAYRSLCRVLCSRECWVKFRDV